MLSTWLSRERYVIHQIIHATIRSFFEKKVINNHVDLAANRSDVCYIFLFQTVMS